MSIPTTQVWEVRTTGDSANGGGFDPSVASAGTDYSVQDAAQVSYTDLVIGATTTQLTSAATPFTSAHVGNTIKVASGTGFTVGYYSIRSVAGTTATMDRAVGTAASTGGVGKLGGALDHPATGGGTYANGNWVHVKAGTYLHGSTANVSGGRLNVASATPLTVVGYTTTRLDGAPTRPVMQANAGSIALWSFGNNFYTVRDVDFYRDPAGGLTGITALSVASFSLVERCRSRNCNAGGGSFVVAGGSVTFLDCEAQAAAVGFFTGSGTTAYLRCVSRGHTTKGFQASANAAVYADCLAVAGSGTTAGFDVATGSSLMNCTSVGNSGNGFAAGGGGGAARAVRCHAQSNGGYGFAGSMRLPGCSGYANTSAHYDNAGGVNVEGFTACSVDPLADVAGLDYTPNAAAGGGASLRAVPFTLPGTATVSYRDVGAVQSQAPAGATATYYAF